MKINAFANEILVKAVEKNNKKKILKDILKERNNLIKNKKLFYHTNQSKFNKNTNLNNKTNSSNKKRINSARPLNLNYNKRFNEIENIINLKNGDSNNLDIPKILAFKENIFVHEKNISLSNKNNYHSEINDIFCNNSKISSSNYNYNNNNQLGKNKNNKNKSKINQKFKRPKSAIYLNNEHNNNLIINQLEICNSSKKKKLNQSNNNKAIQIKSDKISCCQYYDLSEINSSNNKVETYEKIGKNISKQNNDNFMINSTLGYLSQSPSEKKIAKYKENDQVQYNYSNIEDLLLDSKNKISKKINKGHMFRRKPIPAINEKYLIYLPKDLKKDIKNKYNFFSFLLTENLYYNVGEKKKLYTFKNVKKFKGNNIKLEDQKNNKIKNNLTEFNFGYNFNENPDKVGNYKLNCRKEEEFMSYLKHLNYMEKHPHDNIYNNGNINDKKIISKKIKRINNIYKPVKIKMDNSTSYDIEQRNENKLHEKKIGSSEEDSELCEKIKSQPFINKNKPKFNI